MRSSVAAFRTLIQCGRDLRIFVAKFSSPQRHLRPVSSFFAFWFALRLVSGLQPVGKTNGCSNDIGEGCGADEMARMKRGGSDGADEMEGGSGIG
jgi:hypothetical protein